MGANRTSRVEHLSVKLCQVTCNRSMEDCSSRWIERLLRKYIFYEICIHVVSEKSRKDVASLPDCGRLKKEQSSARGELTNLHPRIEG